MILILCQDIKKGEKSRRGRESIREQVGFELDLKGQGRVSGNRRQMGRHLRWREQQEAKLEGGLGPGPSACRVCGMCVAQAPEAARPVAVAWRWPWDLVVVGSRGSRVWEGAPWQSSFG